MADVGNRETGLNKLVTTESKTLDLLHCTTSEHEVFKSAVILLHSQVYNLRRLLQLCTQLEPAEREVQGRRPLGEWNKLSLISILQPRH